MKISEENLSEIYWRSRRRLLNPLMYLPLVGVLFCTGRYWMLAFVCSVVLLGVSLAFTKAVIDMFRFKMETGGGDKLLVIGIILDLVSFAVLIYYLFQVMSYLRNDAYGIV